MQTAKMLGRMAKLKEVFRQPSGFPLVSLWQLNHKQHGGIVSISLQVVGLECSPARRAARLQPIGRTLRFCAIVGWACTDFRNAFRRWLLYLSTLRKEIKLRPWSPPEVVTPEGEEAHGSFVLSLRSNCCVVSDVTRYFYRVPESCQAPFLGFPPRRPPPYAGVFLGLVQPRVGSGSMGMGRHPTILRPANIPRAICGHNVHTRDCELSKWCDTGFSFSLGVGRNSSGYRGLGVGACFFSFSSNHLTSKTISPQTTHPGYFDAQSNIDIGSAVELTNFFPSLMRSTVMVIMSVFISSVLDRS